MRTASKNLTKSTGAGAAKRLLLFAMNRSQIEAALERNMPFTLLMADGKEYHVPHRDYISLPPSGAFVVVYDDKEHVFVLSLLTMTGLSYHSGGTKTAEPQTNP
jgi:hypothetical protein